MPSPGYFEFRYTSYLWKGGIETIVFLAVQQHTSMQFFKRTLLNWVFKPLVRSIKNFNYLLFGKQSKKMPTQRLVNRANWNLFMLKLLCFSSTFDGVCESSSIVYVPEVTFGCQCFNHWVYSKVKQERSTRIALVASQVRCDNIFIEEQKRRLPITLIQIRI